MQLFRCACSSGCSFRHGAVASPADSDRGGSRSGGKLDPALLNDVAVGSRILAAQGVLDAFGHVSVRHPAAADRFLMSRSLAPALVTPDDILEIDLEGQACEETGRSLFIERFIHAEIYRARPDVMSVVHSHSPSVIPFGLVETPMRAMYHNAAFLAEGVPVFDIAEEFGATDMLVNDRAKGVALAGVLGDRSVALMRGHGSVAVGPSLEVAVYQAIMTETNAKLQSQATMLAGEEVNGDPRPAYAERAIHGAIYQARPEVMAVCHNHAPSTIPFGVTGVPLRPIFHMASLIGPELPVWDIAEEFGATDMLVRTLEQGGSLARTLGPRRVALMRGHGSVVAGRSLAEVVMTCVYLEQNARLQIQAMALGDVRYLSDEEIERTSASLLSPLSRERAMGCWRARVAPLG